jgi:ZIP family zinc transporter
LSTFGLLLHEFPEAVIAYFLVRETGAGRYMAAVWAFFAASLTTVVGALLVACVLPKELLDIGALIGLAAGGLLYISAFHLGWHARLAQRGRGYSYMMLGVALALGAVVISAITGGHGH